MLYSCVCVCVYIKYVHHMHILNMIITSYWARSTVACQCNIWKIHEFNFIVFVWFSAENFNCTRTKKYEERTQQQHYKHNYVYVCVGSSVLWWNFHSVCWKFEIRNLWYHYRDIFSDLRWRKMWRDLNRMKMKLSIQTEMFRIDRVYRTHTHSHTFSCAQKKKRRIKSRRCAYAISFYDLKYTHTHTHT